MRFKKKYGKRTYGKKRKGGRKKTRRLKGYGTSRGGIRL